MNYDGDPKLYDSGDGADICVIDGQPVMDEGLENAVYLSLFTSSGWWGNSVSEAEEKYTSEIETLNRRTLTNQTRIDAEKYAESALAWMVSSGVADKITVAATLPEIGFLGLVVTIYQPGKKTDIKYQINWATMAIRVGAA